MGDRSRAVYADPDLGRVPDRDLAARHGVHRTLVGALRRQRGREPVTVQHGRHARLRDLREYLQRRRTPAEVQVWLDAYAGRPVCRAMRVRDCAAVGATYRADVDLWGCL